MHLQCWRSAQAAANLDAPGGATGASPEGAAGAVALGLGILPVLTHSDQIAIQGLHSTIKS